MWWISIIIETAVIIATFIFCNTYFKKIYGGILGDLSLSELQLHENLNRRIFGTTINFFNISANVLLKGIITFICILIIHFTDKLWISDIYVLYLVLTYFVFVRRFKHYNEQLNQTKKAIKPALISSAVLPIAHTIFYISLFVTYYFNK